VHFVGRAAALADLDRMLPGCSEPTTVVISAIGGMAGIGKTALAVHFAHRAAARFPDGQLYVNLRGFDPSGQPVTPGAAIRGFLGALAVPAARIPADLEAQTGLYCTLSPPNSARVGWTRSAPGTIRRPICERCFLCHTAH